MHDIEETDRKQVKVSSAKSKATGSAGKRAFWANHLKGWTESGRTQKEYCQRHDLSVASLHYWKKRIEELGDKGKSRLRMVPFGKASVAEVSRDHQAITIRSGGYRVDVGRGFDPETLQGVLMILRCL